MDHKDYLHRGGRTARAGESGSVFTLVLPEQKRDMGRLMSHAGISPRTAQIKSSDEQLAELTGAREPSGVPVVVETPQPTQPRKPAGSGSGAGGGRSGGRRRRPAAAGGTAGTGTGAGRSGAAGTASGRAAGSTGRASGSAGRASGSAGRTAGAAGGSGRASGG
ncbi:DEAD/DEAH box helicase, partial [Streptomyces sp. NPDC059556]